MRLVDTAVKTLHYHFSKVKRRILGSESSLMVQSVAKDYQDVMERNFGLMDHISMLPISPRFQIFKLNLATGLQVF